MVGLREGFTAAMSIRLTDVVTAGGLSANFAGLLLGLIPPLLAALASLAAIVWIYIQYKWAKEDRKKEGK